MMLELWNFDCLSWLIDGNRRWSRLTCVWINKVSHPQVHPFVQCKGQGEQEETRTTHPMMVCMTHVLWRAGCGKASWEKEETLYCIRFNLYPHNQGWLSPACSGIYWLLSLTEQNASHVPHPSSSTSSTQNLVVHALMVLPPRHMIYTWVGPDSFKQIRSVTQSCPTVCDPMDCSTTGLPVHQLLLELAQTHVHWVGDAIQPSHPLSSPSPPTFNLFQNQGLFRVFYLICCWDSPVAWTSSPLSRPEVALLSLSSCILSLSRAVSCLPLSLLGSGVGSTWHLMAA